MNKIKQMEIDAQSEGYERLPNDEDETVTIIEDGGTFDVTNIQHIIENSSTENKIKFSLSQEQIFTVHTAHSSVQANSNRLSNQASIDLPNSIKTMNKKTSPAIAVSLADCNSERNCLNEHNKLENSFPETNEFSISANEKNDLLRKFSVPAIETRKTDLFAFSNTTNKSRVLDQEFKCSICFDAFVDPRVLDCLHSFCLDCLADIELDRYHKSKANDLCELDFSCAGKTSESTFPTSFSVTSSIEAEQKKTNAIPRPSVSGLANLQAKKEKNVDRKSAITPNKGRLSCVSYTENQKPIQCSNCGHETDVPNGGINNLPPNFILAKKVKEALLKVGMIWCGLCYNDVMAVASCLTYIVNLCGFCIQAHARQRSTLMHEVRYFTESKNETHPNIAKPLINCTLHPDHDIKLFCVTCLQTACSNCALLLHRGHKCEPVRKACRNYLKLIKESLGKTRPIKDCAIDSISKLNLLSRSIGLSAEVVQSDVDTFLTEYLKALEVHRKTLLTQISRAKEAKIVSIKDQQMGLSKRASDADTVIKFTDELMSNGSAIEILTFAGVLLRRFEYCQKSKVPFASKTSDTLKFLPEVRAPKVKSENNIVIPLYGIITTQIAIPKNCTIESNDLMFLRINRKAEIVIVSKDCYDKQLCHGGLTINTDLKYKDSSKHIPTDVSDRRDGTYIICFIPEIVGYLVLSVAIHDKPIKGSPYKLCVRTLRTHSGVFHCCSFCSSNGSKIAKCACGAKMPGGYKGCGHGHSGHPGRRHWSCCGSDLQSSECSATNSFRA